MHCPDDMFARVTGRVWVATGHPGHRNYKPVDHLAIIPLKECKWELVREGAQSQLWRPFGHLAMGYIDHSMTRDQVELQEVLFVHADGRPYDVRAVERAYARWLLDQSARGLIDSVQP